MLLSALIRINLSAGDIETASHQVNALSNLPDASNRSKLVNRALLALARGKWADALVYLQEVLSKNPDDVVASNAVAIALLHLGKMRDVGS
jgi:Flp pilus assembly protein TadD